MHIPLRGPEDRAELDRRIRSANGATLRDRYRAVQLALDGHENKTIQQRLARSKTFVEKWRYAYRDHGLEALTDKPRPRHRKNDAQAMRQWLEDAPLLSTTFKKRIRKNKSKSGSRTKRAPESLASRER